MKTLSRRAFARTLVTAAILPPVVTAAVPAQQTPNAAAPVAGYIPTPEEQRLIEKFLTDHEARMAPLRDRPLANDLPPLFSPRPPVTGRSRS